MMTQYTYSSMRCCIASAGAQGVRRVNCQSNPRAEQRREPGCSGVRYLTDLIDQATFMLLGNFSSLRTTYPAPDPASKKIGTRADANPTGALAVIESIREVRSTTSEADCRWECKGQERPAREGL
jgi:hypothetical protein